MGNNENKNALILRKISIEKAIRALLKTKKINECLLRDSKNPTTLKKELDRVNRILDELEVEYYDVQNALDDIEYMEENGLCRLGM